jgi:hypothetical protein
VSILQGQTTSFKQELLNGYHAFSSAFRAADTFKIALYTSAASLSYATTVYSATNEITGTGYSAGGIALTPIAPASSGTIAYLSFNNAAWPAATFTANGALIYNSTQGNRSVFVLAFGNDKTTTNQTFTIVFPANGATTSVVRIS